MWECENNHNNDLEITGDFLEDFLGVDPLDAQDLEKLLEQVEDMMTSDVQLARDNPCNECGSVGFNDVDSVWMEETK